MVTLDALTDVSGVLGDPKLAASCQLPEREVNLGVLKQVV